MNDIRRGMQERTINAYLSKKIKEWIESIDDEDLRKKVKSKVIVTGGAIASMLLGEEINDIDIYFRDLETTKAVADYYVRKFLETSGNDFDMHTSVQPDSTGQDRVKVFVRSEGIAEDESEVIEERELPDFDDGSYTAEVVDIDQFAEEVALDEKPMYAPVYLSSNAISLKGKIQLVLRFYGDPAQVHASFDFAHCTNYWEGKTGKLQLNLPAMQSLMSRTLQYQGSLYPICSLIRTRKFIKRGWHINAGQYLKMAFQVSKLDLENLQVLEDQLVGVDVAYFNAVIALLKSKDKDKVDQAYLMEIIDRLF